MDDDTYRALLLDLTGKDPCAKLTRGRRQVIEELKHRGFQKKPTRKGKRLISDPQAKKIRAPWLTMADCGIVRDRSEKAPGRCMRRFTGRTLEDATVKQCRAMIEILKHWFDRSDDPKKWAVCLAVLEGDTPPPILDGKLVAEVRHANPSCQEPRLGTAQPERGHDRGGSAARLRRARASCHPRRALDFGGRSVSCPCDQPRRDGQIFRDFTGDNIPVLRNRYKLNEATIYQVIREGRVCRKQERALLPGGD